MCHRAGYGHFWLSDMAAELTNVLKQRQQKCSKTRHEELRGIYQLNNQLTGNARGACKMLHE